MWRHGEGLSAAGDHGIEGAVGDGGVEVLLFSLDAVLVTGLDAAVGRGHETRARTLVQVGFRSRVI